MENQDNAEHICGHTCLGPLTFHTEAVGKKITLSHGNCRASRDLETFQNGLVFSSRPIRVKEKVMVKVERTLRAWEGAMRIGFTNVCPTDGKIPSLAIPDLTDNPGYAALAVPHDDCTPGTMVTFWMASGLLCFKTSTGNQGLVETSLDLSQPLWAIFDVYGQSTTVLLLGSERRHLFRKTSSCPIPHSTFECGYDDTPPKLQRKLDLAKKTLKLRLEDQTNNNPCTTGSSAEEDLCSVCLVSEARLAPRCGHRCLCLPCANRVFAEFGTCPLCRQSI